MKKNARNITFTIYRLSSDSYTQFPANDPGRSWLYGSIDSRGRCSGYSNAFIYPDLNTILLGHMQDENMVKAHESSIVGLTMKSGMLYLKFRYISGPEYKFCPSTLNKVRCNWLQDDPYERKIVYSGPSRMGDHAGDGLFLRKDVPAGTVIAFYNGIRVQPGEIPPFRSNAYQIFLDWKPKYIKVNQYRSIFIFGKIIASNIYWFQNVNVV